MNSVSDIKLIRTDTTLDLSQKASRSNDAENPSTFQKREPFFKVKNGSDCSKGSGGGCYLRPSRYGGWNIVASRHALVTCTKGWGALGGPKTWLLVSTAS